MNGKNQERLERPLREIDLPHHTYQPSQAEMDEDPRVEATFEKVVAACLQPVKIKYVKPAKRKPAILILGSPYSF